MFGVTRITTTEDVTMVHLSNLSNDMTFFSKVLEMFADDKINIDMISQTTYAQTGFDFSFTVPGNQLKSTLSIISTLKITYPNVKILATTGCTKIELYGSEVRTTYGVAYHAISALSEKNVPILMITTSEVDISLLFANADQYLAAEILEKTFN